jgi:DNA polymerase
MAAHDKRLAAKKLLPGEPDPLLEEAMLKVRLGLPEKTWMACETIKRLWRRAHPMISSYWKELENAVVAAIQTPGVTYKARMLKVRRDGAWLRIVLPSGRALCYPDPQVDDDGKITYLGMDTYKRSWGRVKTYGGKLFENVTQAAARDQLAGPMPEIEERGYLTVLHVHDELICETPNTKDFSADELSRMMCADLGWNTGLPLAAAGFETYRYRKE